MTTTYPYAISANSPVALRLEPGALINLRPTVREVRIEVESGNLWITQQGDLADYVLGPGEQFVTHEQGLVVVQALGRSTFRVPGLG